MGKAEILITIFTPLEKLFQIFSLEQILLYTLISILLPNILFTESFLNKESTFLKKILRFFSLILIIGIVFVKVYLFYKDQFRI